MTKLEPYPEYKDSGVDWLGHVPSHWAVRPLGNCFDERRETVSDKEFTPLSVTMSGIVPQLETAAKTDNGDNRKRVNAGDFVINSRSDRKGSAGVSELEGSVSVISTVLAPRAGIDQRFVHHLLRSQPFQEEYYRFGTGIVADLWSTRYSSMKRITLALPTAAEQTGIAAFLDRETAQIDDLIGKQEQLIGLLAEKRQAIITHAVTKGLDPTAPTKASGIPWLGEIPAHWRLSRLADVTEDIVDCLHTTPEAFSDGDYWVVRTSSVRNGRLDLSSSFRTDHDTYLSRTKRLEIADGDLLLTREAPAGEACIVEGHSNLCLGQRMVQLRPLSAAVLPKILLWNIYSDHVRTYFNLETSGSMVQNLTMGRIGRIPIVLPPVAEQQEIARQTSSDLRTIHDSIARAERLASLLRERRSALISAAVTGKIDVREGAA